MDQHTKLFSLDDLFWIVREATLILGSKRLIVCSSDDKPDIEMSVHEFCMMSVADSIKETSNSSAAVQGVTTELLNTILDTMRYDEHVHPEYDGYGIQHIR